MDQRVIDYLQSIGAKPDALDGWSVAIAQRGGIDVAIVITSGPEIHFVSLVGPRAMSRKNIAEHMKPLFDRYGFVTTRTALSEKDHKLREHLGFEPVWCDESCQYWFCAEPPYQRNTMKHTKQGASCQSQ